GTSATPLLCIPALGWILTLYKESGYRDGWSGCVGGCEMAALVRRVAFVVVGMGVLVAALGLLPDQPVHAAPLALLANLPGDAGTESGPNQGEIRYAVNQANANPGSTIPFATAATGPTITLAHGTLTLSQSVTITGPGADLLAVDGGCTFS